MRPEKVSFMDQGGVKKWQNLDEADSREILGREQCIKQLALSADRNAKFLSSQQKASQFIAKNAMLKEDQNSDFAA
jgi:hypothetical protein